MIKQANELKSSREIQLSGEGQTAAKGIFPNLATQNFFWC